jgi:hypothetical protein
MPLHMIKLCVGCDTVEELLEWRRAEGAETEPWIMRTRQTPKRAEELVDGGSLYRVYRGFILSRQRILAVDRVGEGPSARCEVTLDPNVILTAPTPRRAFQGWRYLLEAEAPPDLGAAGAAEAPLSADLAKRLREIGAW